MAKTSNANIDNAQFAEQAGDAATPPSGYWRLFFKSGGMYAVDDAGTVIGPFGTGGAQQCASVSTATSSSASGWRTLSWTTEDADTGGFFSSGTPTRFTITETGIYTISLNVRFGNDSTGERSICFTKNGTPGSSGDQLAGHYSIPGVPYFQTSITWSGPLTAGDYIAAGAFTSNTVNGPDAIGPNNFSIVRNV